MSSFHLINLTCTFLAILFVPLNPQFSFCECICILHDSHLTWYFILIYCLFFYSLHSIHKTSPRALENFCLCNQMLSDAIILFVVFLLHYGKKTIFAAILNFSAPSKFKLLLCLEKDQRLSTKNDYSMFNLEKMDGGHDNSLQICKMLS